MKFFGRRWSIVEYIFALSFIVAFHLIALSFPAGRRTSYSAEAFKARQEGFMLGVTIIIVTLAFGIYVGWSGRIPFVRWRTKGKIEERILVHSDGTTLVNADLPEEPGWRAFVRYSNSWGKVTELVADPGEYALLVEGCTAELVVSGRVLLSARVLSKPKNS